VQIVAYLSFNGNCREAFEFYAKALGGEILMMMTARGTPAAEFVAPEHQDSIMHARLQVGDALLMGSDAMGPSGYQTPQGITVSLQLSDPAEAERIFAALGEGGEVWMPMEETFWALRFGGLTDRFGIPWMVNCEAQR
jgi:PhnB protein